MNTMGKKKPLTTRMIVAKEAGICMRDGCSRSYFSTGECKLHYGKKWYIDNPEARVHLNMKARCYRKNHPEYRIYGARGITICDRWRFGEDGKTGFRCFMEDMGKRPDNKHSIDRINNDGNYEPDNCRWALSDTQSINKRPARVNKLGHIGVHQNGNGWFAFIDVHNKRHWLGSHATLQGAIDAREKAEEKYHKPLLEVVK